MKTVYTPEDIARGTAWYNKHKAHVDRLIENQKHEYPMSGSDISRPELWKAGGWKWFLKNYGDASFTISFLIAWYMFCDTPYGWQIMAHPEFEGVKMFPLWIFGIA